MAPLHPSYQDVASAYQEFYKRLFFYLDDAGSAIPEDFAGSLDVDLCDVWDRFESRCVPCSECECWPCRCEADR